MEEPINMSIKFQELRKYLARNARISLCFSDGHYQDYLMVSDIPEAKYGDLYVYGIGLVDAEFHRDVYRPPVEPESEFLITKDYTMDPAIEIVLMEESRDFERSTDKVLLFKDLKPYLQIGRYFSVVKRKDWSEQSYEWKREIPKEYDDMFVYGISMENNPYADESLKDIDYDTVLNKRMVLVLSDTPREDIEEKQ